MKPNKDWKPAIRGGGHARYQRAKLKNHKWHTPEEASSIDKEYNSWRKNWHRGRFNINHEPDWHLEVKLIRQYVDQPFEEFLKAWHDRTALLRRRGVVLKLRCIEPEMKEFPSITDDYYVDMNGIIRANEDRLNRPHRKPICIVEKSAVEYFLNPDIYNKDKPWTCKYSGIIDILRKFLKKGEINAILQGPISETRFLAMKNRLSKTFLSVALYEYRKRYEQSHGIVWQWGYSNHYVLCPYGDFEDLFVKDTSKSVYKYIHPGTKEYKRYYAEKNKHKWHPKKDHSEYDEDIVKNNKEQAIEKVQARWEKTRNNISLIPND